MKIFFLLFFIFLTATSTLKAAFPFNSSAVDPVALSTPLLKGPEVQMEPAVFAQSEAPLFLADLTNPNDFTLFANGGWDGNWYVGFNTCWIQRVDVPKNDAVVRAYIGAKLGRMKSIQASGKPPWEKVPYSGEIYMAISSTPAWNRKQSFFIANTSDIPLEPDADNAVQDTGEAQWFWAEVPLRQINFNGANFIALWSPSETLTSASSAPILAAGWGNKEVNTWIVNDLKGVPPSDPKKALSTPVTVFEPAIAIKLISETKGQKPECSIVKIAEGKRRRNDPAPKVVWTAIRGESIERVWMEISVDQNKWSRYGRPFWKAPYIFTLNAKDLPIGPDGKTWVRVKAVDVHENESESPARDLFALE